MLDKLIEHNPHFSQALEDLPEIRNWKWSSGATPREKPLVGKTPVPT
ncbi:MAG: hypothetical protein V7K97_03030 [Nostoc sp.]